MAASDGRPVAGFAGFPEEALEFYAGLEADNSKAYWSDHKAGYETFVRAPMQALLAAVAAEFGESPLFRPYRDVRFSADKTPYKTAAAAVVRSPTRGTRYVELSADGLYLGGGYWHLAGDQVERLRVAVADDRIGIALERLVDGLRAEGYEVVGERLKTRPRGYPADHPRLELLKHKSLAAGRRFAPDQTLHSAACLERVRTTWRACDELVAWLDREVGPTRLPEKPRR